MKSLKELGHELACTGFTRLAVATNKGFYLEYEMANEHVNMTMINITSWLPRPKMLHTCTMLFHIFEIIAHFCLVRTEIFLKNIVYRSCTVNKMHISPIASLSTFLKQHLHIYLQ